MQLDTRRTVITLALVYCLFAVGGFLSAMPASALWMSLVVFLVFGSLIVAVGIAHGMKHETWKAIIALVLIYGSYTAFGSLSPMPMSALQIGLLVYVVFGAAALTVSVAHGQYRASQRQTMIG